MKLKQIHFKCVSQKDVSDDELENLEMCRTEILTNCEILLQNLQSDAEERMKILKKLSDEADLKDIEIKKLQDSLNEAKQQTLKDKADYLVLKKENENLTEYTEQLKDSLEKKKEMAKNLQKRVEGYENIVGQRNALRESMNAKDSKIVQQEKDISRLKDKLESNESSEKAKYEKDIERLRKKIEMMENEQKKKEYETQDQEQKRKWQRHRGKMLCGLIVAIFSSVSWSASAEEKKDEK